MTTLVLLPGLDGSGEMFAPLIEALDGFPTQVIAYPPDLPMTYAEHEAYVRSRLSADEDFVLLAESFSGPIGISIAANAPPNLKALILCVTFASNPFPKLAPLSRLIGALPAARIPPALVAPLLYAGRATPKLRQAHAQAMARVSPKAIRARAVALLKVDYRPLLRRIEVPILYMRATQDRMVGASACDSIRQLRPDVELAELDTPHFLLQTEPQRSAAIIKSFIHSKVG